jgi:hypothetical protein
MRHHNRPRAVPGAQSIVHSPVYSKVSQFPKFFKNHVRSVGIQTEHTWVKKRRVSAYVEEEDTTPGPRQEPLLGVQIPVKQETKPPASNASYAQLEHDRKSLRQQQQQQLIMQHQQLLMMHQQQPLIGVGLLVGLAAQPQPGDLASCLSAQPQTLNAIGRADTTYMLPPTTTNLGRHSKSLLLGLGVMPTLTSSGTPSMMSYPLAKTELLTQGKVESAASPVIATPHPLVRLATRSIAHKYVLTTLHPSFIRRTC